MAADTEQVEQWSVNASPAENAAIDTGPDNENTVVLDHQFIRTNQTDDNINGEHPTLDFEKKLMSTGNAVEEVGRIVRAYGTTVAFYTILAEDEDTSDPVTEEVKSILDGHIMLSRSIGESGQYPPIDILASTSRVFRSIVSESHLQSALTLRSLMAKYKDNELLLSMGEYHEGLDEVSDRAISNTRVGAVFSITFNRNKTLIDNLLRQTPEQCYTLEDSLQLLATAIE